MKVPIRKTISGTEYWDTKAKKIVFVTKGEKPKFDVTKDPESMISGVDLTTGPDLTSINGEVIDTQSLDEMNADQLRAFAKDNDIELPFNVKKEETIRKRIQEALDADDEQ
ncbi:hypothetical protein J2Z23_004182 [Lederbergia galactosidilyticus]|uniref:hypothetical protein n=1 Tax=Lederbergia galactosidilytica TaxID=217031 RepID=UPI001AEA6977|nr:hypothetical protein [Lederbergia galactosidilytica]MBP1917197.1 hypothetical protein [Lederbergia galactosidilytica]